MKATLKVKIKSVFDEKVSNIVCHRLNELCGQKWTKNEIREVLNSTSKCYLNEIGRKYNVGKSLVKYASAYYVLVLPKQFITLTGEQICVWLYRENTNESFGRINIGTDDDFDFAVVTNTYYKEKALKNK